MYIRSLRSENLLILTLILVVFTFTVTKAQLLNSSLPANYPEIEILKNSNPSEDYLFLGLTAGGIGHLMIVDNDAVPVFYKRIDGTIFNFLWQKNGELTYNIYPDSSYGLDSSGILVNRFFTPDSFNFDFHELTVLEDGTYYVLGQENVVADLSGIVPGGQVNATLITQNIYHMDTLDNEIWRWRSFDHYDILDVDSAVDLTSFTIDWTHCNSVKADYDGNILLSTRNFNEITKINRQTGEIIWRLGGERNQFKFINDDRKFARQHDAKRNAAGNLILFDNGVRLVPQYSSLVEYELDEDSLTANLIRRFSKGDTLWSRIRGGVQGLSNGNHLICWGERNDPAVTEINSNNEIVYEIRFPTGAHRYRSFRFPWKTNFFYVNNDSLNFGEVSIGDSITVPITFYNWRDQQAIINEVFNDDSAFYINESLPFVIPSNDSVIITITFKPYSIEYKNDSKTSLR
jgi:outer membrane protein assembly factor BamB